MQILEDKENFLMNRREMRVVVEAEKNPSYEQATNMISQEFKADKENIVIKQVKGKFGRNTFLISAFIYKTKEDKERFEPKKKEEEKKEEEKAEQTKEEKPEDKKEEKKAEEK